MKKMTLILTLVLAMGVVFAACGSSDDTSDKSASVEVTDVWARATTPTQDSGAIYMTINSEEDDSLIKAEVPTSVAGMTELHETTTGGEPTASEDTMESGDSAMDSADSEETSGMTGDSGSTMMGMKQVSQIDIPGGETVTLEPGGYHIMLMDLKGQIKAGDTIPVTLTFENAGTVKVDATAKDE